jgi:hypothetical protein
MAEITRSTDVGAAVGDVDKDWTQFMFRKLVGHDEGVSEADLEWTPADDAERDGTVRLEALAADRTRVTVTVEFDGDEATVAAHLERDLELFRDFAETRRPAHAETHHSDITSRTSRAA